VASTTECLRIIFARQPVGPIAFFIDFFAGQPSFFFIVVTFSSS